MQSVNVNDFFSRPYGALRDGLARAGNILVKRLFDGRRAHRAHDKVQPAIGERLHDGDGKEPAVEHGDQGPDAPPGAGVEQLGDDVRLCPLGEQPRDRRAVRVVPGCGEQGRVRLGLAGPVLVLGPDHVLVLFLPVVRHVVDVDYVDHGVVHYSGAPYDLHLGVEHEVASLLHLLGAYRAEQPKQPLVGGKPDLAPVPALYLLVRILASLGPERGDGRVGAHAVAHHVRQYGRDVVRAEQCVLALREWEADECD